VRLAFPQKSRKYPPKIKDAGAVDFTTSRSTYR
jgi:hypothetical protein